MFATSIVVERVLVLVPIAACAAALILMVWVTAARRDLWPFCTYPMFATYRSVEEVRFYQIRFVLGMGTVCTLPAVFAGAAEEFHRTFDRLQRTLPEPAALAMHAALVERHATEAARLDPRLAEAVRVEVWERSVSLRSTGAVAVTERCVRSLEPHVQRT